MTSEDKIQQLGAILGLEHDREFVVAILRKNNDNVEAAIESYFTNPNRESYKDDFRWDEAAFGMDREGSSQNNNNVPALTFDHVENANMSAGQPGYTLPAPSRPPSRANTRSPLGRLIDWAGPETSGAPLTHEQEDADLKRAMQLSAAEYGFAPQETGVVVDTSVKYFGPANRDEYDQTQWGMVHVKRSTEPPPSARRRSSHQTAPAFLRNARVLGSEENPVHHRIGSILTILHEIPAARNFLLSLGAPAPTYGNNSEWWKGQQMVAPHVLAAMQRGDTQFSENTEPPLNEEIHRLMAFLDGTERSYGSGDVVADLKSVVPFPGWGGDPEKNLLDAIRDLVGTENTSLLASQLVDFGLNNDVRLASESTMMINFDAVSGTDIWNFIKSLYNAFDIYCWTDVLLNGPEPSDVSMKVFARPAEVLIMRFGVDGVDDRIDVPEIFYLDQFTEERRADAKDIQHDLVDVYRALNKANELEEQAKKWVDPAGQVYDRTDQLAKAIKLDKQKIRWLEETARWRTFQAADILETSFEEASLELTPDEVLLKEAWENEIQLCEEELAETNAKLQRIEDEKALCRKIVTNVTARFTKPNPYEPELRYAYSLRGIATTKDVVYVRRRSEPELIDIEEDVTPTDQWWRLAYMETDPEPLKVQKMSFEEMIKAVFDECKTPLIIYATEQAMSETPLPLSDALQTFVRHDNRFFLKEIEQELQSGQNQQQQGGQEHGLGGSFVGGGGIAAEVTVTPLSPSKRKYRAGSPDSLDTNRASLGDGDSDMVLGDSDVANPSSAAFAAFDDDGGGVPLLSPDLARSDATNLPPSPPSYAAAAAAGLHRDCARLSSSAAVDGVGLGGAAVATANLAQLARSFGGANNVAYSGPFDVGGSALDRFAAGRMQVTAEEVQEDDEEYERGRPSHQQHQQPYYGPTATRTGAEGGGRAPEMQERAGGGMMPFMAKPSTSGGGATATGGGGSTATSRTAPGHDPLSMDLDHLPEHE